MKKPVVAFTVCDKNNEKYAEMLKNSLRKFHTEEELPLVIIKGEELLTYTKDDPMFFYRQKPIIGDGLLKEYDLVIGLDCDQIVLGDISYIWKTKDYDVGTVLNYNRVDPPKFGYVQFQGVLPVEYMNCGLVSMRSERFVHDWKVLCFSQQFDRLQYKEQDLLNAMIFYGNWNVRCFDLGDGIAKMKAWWGMISKGEWNRAELRGDEIICPKGLGDTPFPPDDMTLKIIHPGGGNQANKMNYATWFREDIVKRIDYLVSEK